MPVRRRKSKARPDEAEAWAGFMQCGRDYFDDLKAVGLTDATAMPLAEEVWCRIGDDVIAYLDELHIGFRPYERPIWAEKEFGEPGKRLRRRG